MKNGKKIVLNSTMLFIMNIAKLIFPLLTLPYLTRILSVEKYGVVAYVKSIMTYMQVFVDFGFILSATKDIVQNKEDKEKVEYIVGNAFMGRLILALVGAIFLIIISYFIPLLHGYEVYLILSHVSIILSCFFVEYLFRGIEQMHLITIRFVLMKFVSTTLTFIFVKGDADILWIPILDIVSYLFAAILTYIQIRKMGYKIKISKFSDIFSSLRTSFLYFLSNMASTAFNVLNTFLIGIFATSTEVAYWSVCLQLINAVQCLYSPISDGIYPEMVKNKNFKIIKTVLKYFVPIIVLGCIFTILVSKYVLIIVGGNQYIYAAPILRCLTPVLFFSFFTYIFGWPALGAIGKVNETTKTTIISAIFQIIGLFFLVFTNLFTIVNVAILRSLTEFLISFLRIYYCYKFKKEFQF